MRCVLCQPTGAGDQAGDTPYVNIHKANSFILSVTEMVSGVRPFATADDGGAILINEIVRRSAWNGRNVDLCRRRRCFERDLVWGNCVAGPLCDAISLYEPVITLSLGTFSFVAKTTALDLIMLSV